MPPESVVRLATRASLLARTQSSLVARALAQAHAAADPLAPPLELELVHVSTHGDRSSAPIEQLGGTGVFVTAVREAVLEGRCELAVHSLKDLPTRPAEGLAPPVIPERADPRDALCARDGFTLATLPAGAVVGTGSPRRAAAVLAERPDLQVVGLRGNVDSRLGRVGVDLDAVVLAAAGLERIDRLDAATELLDPATVPPAPGQGALAVEVRAELDPEHPLARALAAVDHAPSRLAVLAERALLARLEAGCSAPLGALGVVQDGQLELAASAFAADGRRRIDVRGSAAVGGGDAELRAVALGERLAVELLAQGARELAGVGG